MNKSAISNSAGMSLVELVLVVGLCSLVTLVLGAASSLAFQSIRSVELSVEFAALMDEVQQVMSSPQSCAANLKGVAIDPGSLTGAPFSDNRISYFDTTVSPAVRENDIASEGGKHSGILIESIRLIPQGVVNTSAVSEGLDMIADVVVRGQAAGMILTRSFPIQVRTTDGIVTECVGGFTSGDSSELPPSTKTEICEVVGGRTYIFNSETEKCESAVSFQWFVGNETRASCARGWQPSGKCKMTKPSGFVDPNYIRIDRSFTNGSSQVAVAFETEPGVTRYDNATKTCGCYYELNTSSAGWTCQIECFQATNGQ